VSKLAERIELYQDRLAQARLNLHETEKLLEAANLRSRLCPPNPHVILRRYAEWANLEVAVANCKRDIKFYEKELELLNEVTVA